jgi:hypothetical protein
MHIRVSRVRRNGKTYEYAQLVESYRRDSDGLPVHRVIATFGNASDLEVRNLREALAASRKGKRVLVARVPHAATPKAPKPTMNLRYLDVAVLLELWRDWGLDDLLEELMPTSEAELRPASIVAALSIQRCVDPGSTLYATRWLPRTALVELLHLAPRSFNNTRLHRVLDDLDTVTSALMSKLPRRYAERDGAFVSLFLDVSDAWFVGNGPALAERGKTKEGLVRQKIGIVLLCNEHGFPLRWDVIAGAQHDSIAMTQMLSSIAGLSWVGEAPVVCDRAMGKTAQIRAMIATGLRFLTALTVTEFDAYTQAIPHESFAHLDLDADSTRSAQVEQAAQCAQAAGMHKAADDLFVLELGIVERAEAQERKHVHDGAEEVTDGAEEVTIVAMRLCRHIEQAVAQGRYGSYAAAGRAAGLTKSLTNKYRLLGRLSEQQQRDILEGKAAGHTLADLIQIASIADRDQRQEAFVARMGASTGKPPRKSVAGSSSAVRQTPQAEPQRPVRVRAVAYFNPDRFVEERVRAREQLDRIGAFEAELNAKLSSPHSKHTAKSIAAAVDRRLRSDALLNAFEVRITERPLAGRTRFSVELLLDKNEWARRRRNDGFSVLVAHPDVSRDAVDLCRLYRAKDAVEKDFQVIKSMVQLRPIWHRTDGKVRAHVTLCMLALLLERTLKRRLNGSSTVEAALELLESCRLNLFAGQDGPPAYTITHPNPEQKAILHALRLQSLANDEELADRITPR